MSQTTDEEEHSIEMHLPFIAKVILMSCDAHVIRSCDMQVMESKRDQFTIVPVLVGALKEGKEAVYGKLFSTYLADPQNLFVVSSDFCHWGNTHLTPLPLPQYLYPSLQGRGSDSPTTTKQMDLFTVQLRS